MDPGYRYGGEAVFLIGVAVRIIQWIARTSREIQDDDRPTSSTLSSLLSPAPAMAVIADPPRLADHRCPKCGTLIHADVVHGGFSPCRKCGWSPSSPASPSS
jgi:hypothetical protein